MSTFTPASRKTVKLRMSLAGQSGSGKTYTALSVASVLAEGERFAVIDTEHGSSALYDGVADFDIAELSGNYHPDCYIEALFAAAKEGYRVLVIDSLSHAWNGPGGVLEQVEKEAQRSRSNNSFAAWGTVGTPLQNRLVSKVLNYPGHVIFTMRSKQEWALEEDERGKKVPKKHGLAPVQRNDLDYEVTVAGEMMRDHTLIVTKSRFEELADAVIEKPGREFGEAIAAACARGVANEDDPAPADTEESQP